MITLKEIAEKCNVSIATVSNILNGKSNFSEDTRDKILKVVRETGYKPNYMARTLRAHKTNTIGLIVDDLIDFSAASIVDGVMSFCEQKGYKLVLENIRLYAKSKTTIKTAEQFRVAVDQACQEMEVIKVDGIIYIASHSRNMDCIPKNLDVPVVLSYAYNEDSIPSVVFDDESAAYEMTQYLIRNGHKKIAVIGGFENSLHTQRRFVGFEKAMEDNKLSFEKKMYYWGNWGEQSGYDACNNLLESHEEFSAIFCFNDVMACGVYKSLTEHGLKPGVDISVVGFDDREFCGYLQPALTTMRIPLWEIGEKSAQVLMDCIEEKDVELISNLKCQFVERNSVKNITSI